LSTAEGKSWLSKLFEVKDGGLRNWPNIKKWTQIVFIK
jgi:hypothetical protein